MIPPEYMPVIIQAHQRDLRRLYEPPRPGIPQYSLRQRLGALIVRFGHWVEDRCSEVTTEPTIPASSEQVRA